MDAQEFDRWVQALGRARTRRGVLGLLAGAAGLGVGEAAAKRRRGRPRLQAAAADRVTICHRTDSAKHPFRVITVAASAVPEHEAHGDLVACPNLQILDVETCTCVCPVADIVCPPGQRLDPIACTCVDRPDGCRPDQCERDNNECTECRCMGVGPGSRCACRSRACDEGVCIPGIGCVP